ncbi:DUF484 family protein [Marinicella sediminis]|uniref:DUF484 family protein n=1 Tax=Marinicella sediminis TaxID=1792834 RepID=A0ABV7J3M9_9GAMM|nr:DUF484 family protein [Marinicella sediminis]
MSESEIKATDIKAYLESHPEFFAEHPQLLNQLKVTSPKGQLTNLTTHQLRILQDKNQVLNKQLNQLIRNAQQSESLMNRLVDMLTDLTGVSAAHYLTAFVEQLHERFPSEHTRLVLPEGLAGDNRHDDLIMMTAAIRQQFSLFQMKTEPLAGRLKSEQLNSLFGEQQIGSAIVLPIGNQAEFGLLAFASQEEDKFPPNASSDILQKLTGVLCHYFQQTHSGDETQVMS